MKYSQAEAGRVFVVRLEDGDIVHKEIEALARKEGVQAGSLVIVGGADRGSTLIVGPEAGRASPVVPMEHRLPDVHEVAGVGTIFPDESGNPVLHMHMACGRRGSAVAGCVRKGVKVWHTMEAVLYEITDTTGTRVFDPGTGFSLLRP